MDALNDDLDMVLTRLTEHLLRHEQTYAEAYVMARGQLYRTELRTCPIAVSELPNDF